MSKLAQLQNEIVQREEIRQQFMEYAHEKFSYNAHTPDLQALSRKKSHRVFLYGESMCSISGAHTIEEFGKRQATAFSVRKFELWKKKLGRSSFPFALEPHFKTVQAQSLKGELWKMTTEGLLDLDFSLRNGVEFQRVRAMFSIPYREVVFLKNRLVTKEPGEEPSYQSIVTSNEPRVMHVSAWVYVGVSSYWVPQVDGGYLTSPVSRFKSKRTGEQYYFFTNAELNSES